MKPFEKLLEDYESDIRGWESDFSEGDLFLAHREALIPYEEDEKVVALDKKALEVIEHDKSVGSDKLFLEKLKALIERNTTAHAA